MTNNGTHPPSPDGGYFTLEEVGPGVYAAIAADAIAGANAGLVNLGGGALIFDTGVTPQAGEALRDLAERVLRVPVRYVVNSHWHADHVLGNPGVPPNALLISTTHTRQLMETRIPASIKQFKGMRQSLEQELRDFRAKLEQERKPDRRGELQEEIDYYTTMLAAIPLMKLRLPDWTFEREVILHGEKRSVELLTFGGGHTASDAILHVPDAGVVFAADLLFNGYHPWLGDGDPAAWLRTLDDITRLEADTIIPGHGPVSTPAEFGFIRSYIPKMQELAAALPFPPPEDEDGEPLPPEIPAMPEEYRDLISNLIGMSTFDRNIESLYARLHPPQS